MRRPIYVNNRVGAEQDSNNSIIFRRYAAISGDWARESRATLEYEVGLQKALFDEQMCTENATAMRIMA